MRKGSIIRYLKRIILASLESKPSRKKKDCHFFYHAPTLIIASNRPNYENAMTDCSLPLENLFLAARSLGLGSCYINQLHWLRNDPELREFLFELGILREHIICSSAAVGYIAKESSVPPRKAGTIHIIKWVWISCLGFCSSLLEACISKVNTDLMIKTIQWESLTEWSFPCWNKWL